MAPRKRKLVVRRTSHSAPCPSKPFSLLFTIRDQLFAKLYPQTRYPCPSAASLFDGVRVLPNRMTRTNRKRHRELSPGGSSWRTITVRAFRPPLAFQLWPASQQEK